jgi:lipopolysaccharide/colanic/teichoic acid biosynthesis glycosyltransferase
MKRKSIKDFFQENPDERIVALVNRYLSGVDLDGCNVLLVSDANVLDGIANEGSFRCIASSAALNDYVRVNKSLAKIYRLLNSRGVFVGHVETSEQYGARVSSRYNFIVAKIIILFSFVFERVIPKLFGLRHVIDKFGLNKHHRLTKCEALGRLRYCGFQILKLMESNSRLYFVTRKSVIPMNGAPCDGLLIKIQKVGLKGSTVNCYKLRTMHAYANYIHDYVLDNLEIDNNGKVVRDFRVPGWGKILRKFWLDEMPQLLNILKGELTFIGLRHLSREFLELYPEDWRNERMKLRPGFVPPYYADCPKTFEDIIESEKRYYRLKKKYPITTDVYYFIRVVINFLTLKARTG